MGVLKYNCLQDIFGISLANIYTLLPIASLVAVTVLSAIEYSSELGL